MQTILTAGMYSSLLTGNYSTAVGCMVMKDAFKENKKSNN